MEIGSSNNAVCRNVPHASKDPIKKNVEEWSEKGFSYQSSSTMPAGPRINVQSPGAKQYALRRPQAADYRATVRVQAEPYKPENQTKNTDCKSFNIGINGVDFIRHYLSSVYSDCYKNDCLHPEDCQHIGQHY